MTRLSIGLRLLTVLATVISATSSSAEAGAPNTISYQGRLTDDSGSPVSDSTYPVAFALLADSIGGDPLWSESAVVTTVDGLFSHLLGSSESLPTILFEQYDQLFLELSIDGTPMTPRARLASVPYAQRAANLEVRDSDDTVAIKTFTEQHRLSIYDRSGQELMRLQGDSAGDGSVVLPDSSINSAELLDEPGITYDINVYPVMLVTMEMTDLAVVEIETPADGYIVLEGKCYFVLSGTTGPNTALVQIDETAGGGTQFPYYSVAGLSGYVNSGDCYFPVYISRVYYRPAGVYEFRMEGRASYPAPAEAWSWDHVLKATYYPTGYGVVSQVSDRPGENPSAVPVQITDPQNPQSRDTYYQMDLRHNEGKSRTEDTARKEAD